MAEQPGKMHEKLLSPMKRIITFTILLFLNFSFAQNIILNKVEKTGNSKDKFLYKINADSVKSEYLGEIEIQGFSADDVAVFNAVYKKAKSIGANAFSYKPFPSIDNIPRNLDPSNYKLSLYQVSEADLPDESNLLYIVSSSSKTQKIGIDRQNLELPARSFILKRMLPGETYSLSTKKFLGSSVKVQANSIEGKQFFQFSAFKIKSNPYGSAGINVKSGDIFKLEKSYGDFLTTIYEQVGNN